MFPRDLVDFVQNLVTLSTSSTGCHANLFFLSSCEIFKVLLTLNNNFCSLLIIERGLLWPVFRLWFIVANWEVISVFFMVLSLQSSYENGFFSDSEKLDLVLFGQSHKCTMCKILVTLNLENSLPEWESALNRTGFYIFGLKRSILSIYYECW